MPKRNKSNNKQQIIEICGVLKIEYPINKYLYQFYDIVMFKLQKLRIMHF